MASKGRVWCVTLPKTSLYLLAFHLIAVSDTLKAKLITEMHVQNPTLAYLTHRNLVS